MISRSRFLLLILSLLAAAVCVRLGFWQLSRLSERRSANREAAAGRAGTVMTLNPPATPGQSRANRRVEATGRFDRQHEIVLRGHVLREVPGIHVVTPFRLQGSDSAVLVNRGFVPSPDATFAATDSLDEPGLITLAGLALPVPVSDDGGAPLTGNGKETWRRLDLPALRARIPYPLLDIYILQAPDSSLPRYPRRLEPPVLDDGPHLSYAVQWFAFAAIAVAGGVIFALRKEP
jgi:surfeit locus 1 family protein